MSIHESFASRSIEIDGSFVCSCHQTVEARMAALVFSLRFDSLRHEAKVLHGSSSSRVGRDDKRVAGRSEISIQGDYSKPFDRDCGGVVVPSVGCRERETVGLVVCTTKTEMAAPG